MHAGTVGIYSKPTVTHKRERCNERKGVQKILAIVEDHLHDQGGSGECPKQGESP